ncbi:MAG: glycosyltransferase [Treponema sp.]|nr:glycosyltransferase [Treponema sp.]
MKIAMFTDAYWPRVNGVSVSVDSFSRALVKEGHDVLVVCPSYPQDLSNMISMQKEAEAEDVLKIIKVPSVTAIISKEDQIAKSIKWKWVFKQVDVFNPDIIHVNTEVTIAEFGISYAKSHNLPVVYTLHTMWEDYAPNYFPMFPPRLVRFVVRGIVKNVIKRSYRIIVPTPQIEETVIRYKLNSVISKIPTGIEIDMFERDEVKSSELRIKLENLFPKLREKRILLFAGRVAKEKNIGFLLRILPDILVKHPDVVLLIAGNGPDLEYYKEEAIKIGIENNCVFTGYFDRKDLALVYSMAEIFLFPSLTDTQGLVTLESMLAGTPVVAIGAMGTLTVMGGDNGGFMVKDDMSEFTARVLDLLGNPELHKSKSLEAITHARSWSIEELTKKLISLYNSTINDYIKEYGHRVTPRSLKKILSKLRIKK